MEKKNCFILTDSLDKYQDKEFTGYRWWSDKTMPEFIDGKFNLPAIGENPFVVEAIVRSKDGKISVSVEHNDGCYLVGIVNWEDADQAEKDGMVVLEPQTYLTHRLRAQPGDEKYNKIRFERAWIPVEDPLCEGMEVLQPAWRAFTGFDK